MWLGLEVRIWETLGFNQDLSLELEMQLDFEDNKEGKNIIKNSQRVIRSRVSY